MGGITNATTAYALPALNVHKAEVVDLEYVSVDWKMVVKTAMVAVPTNKDRVIIVAQGSVAEKIGQILQMGVTGY